MPSMHRNLQTQVSHNTSVTQVSTHKFLHTQVSTDTSVTQQIYKKTQKQSQAAIEAEEKRKQIDDLGFEVGHMIMLQQKNYSNSANSIRSPDRGK